MIFAVEWTSEAVEKKSEKIQGSIPGPTSICFNRLGCSFYPRDHFHFHKHNTSSDLWLSLVYLKFAE